MSGFFVVVTYSYQYGYIFQIELNSINSACFRQAQPSLRLIADRYEMEHPDGPKTQAEFVIRLKGKEVTPGSTFFTTVKEQSVSREDREAGVVRDRIVRLRSDTAFQLGLYQIELREVTIE